MRTATTHTTVKTKIPTTGAELLRTPTNMPGQYSYTFMAQSTHTTIAFEEIVATNSTILLCNFTLQEVGGRYVAVFAETTPLENIVTGQVSKHCRYCKNESIVKSPGP